jgi:aminoglycoside phosphotransferase (APT) family kinase protein
VAVDPVIEPPSAGETPTGVAAAWTAAIDVLVGLHATPVDELALGPEPVRRPADELAVWAATIDAARLEDDRGARALLAALGAAVPERARLSVVHGDFRLGNLLMQGPRPRALIDWEIWSLGDPAVDLGWFVQFTDPSNFPGVGREVPGTPSAETVLARYCAQAGEERGRLDWFVALGCLKLAAIQAHNRRRHLDGRYHDPYQELLGPSIARLLERGLEILPGRAGASA